MIEKGIDGKCIICGILTKDTYNNHYTCIKHIGKDEYFIYHKLRVDND